MRSSRFLFTLLICIAATGFARAEEKSPALNAKPASDKPPASPAEPNPIPAAPETKTPPATLVPADPAQIARWITDLGAPEYDLREAATVKLSQAGAPAVEPLLLAAEGNSLEVSSRAIRALQALYLNPDESLQESAESALEKLTASTNKGVARRATTALAQRVAHQQQRALKKIERAGGIITYFTTPQGPAKGHFGEAKLVDIRIDEGWKGGNAALEPLRKLKDLPKLYIIDGAPVADHAVDSLHADLPFLAVEHRGRALLGVEGQMTEGMCLISGVAEQGAAAKAGIKPGDIIVKYDGVELKNFKELIDLTKKKRAGDKVAVEVMRPDLDNTQGQRLKLTIELGGWRSPFGNVRRER